MICNLIVSEQVRAFVFAFLFCKRNKTLVSRALLSNISTWEFLTTLEKCEKHSPYIEQNLLMMISTLFLKRPFKNAIYGKDWSIIIFKTGKFNELFKSAKFHTLKCSSRLFRDCCNRYCEVFKNFLKSIFVWNLRWSPPFQSILEAHENPSCFDPLAQYILYLGCPVWSCWCSAK